MRTLTSSLSTFLPSSPTVEVYHPLMEGQGRRVLVPRVLLYGPTTDRTECHEIHWETIWENMESHAFVIAQELFHPLRPLFACRILSCNVLLSWHDHGGIHRERKLRMLKRESMVWWIRWALLCSILSRIAKDSVRFYSRRANLEVFQINFLHKSKSRTFTSRVEGGNKRPVDLLVQLIMQYSAEETK